MIPLDLQEFQFKPPFSKWKRFQEFIVHLLNEIHNTRSFQERSRPGQKQNGYDVFSLRKRIAVECKLKSVEQSDKEFERELRNDLAASIEMLKASGQITSFDEYILASTWKDDKSVQDKAIQLSTEYGITVAYWGWNKILNHLNQCDKTNILYFKDFYDTIQDYYRPNFIQDFDLKSRNKEHILLQLYSITSRYFPFVTLKPHTLSNIFPINGTEGFVRQEPWGLTVTNEKAKKFLIKTSFQDNGSIKFQAPKSVEKAGIEEPERKFKDVLNFLRWNLVAGIEENNAWNLKTLPSSPMQAECNCDRCTLNRLSFDRILKKLSSKKKYKNNPYDNFRRAWAFHKIGEFGEAYYVLERIKSEASDDEILTKFLADLNLTYLIPFIRYDYPGKDREGILEEISSIDAYQYVHLTRENPELQAQIIWFLEAGFVKKIGLEMDEYLSKIRKAYQAKRNPQNSIHSLLQKLHYLFFCNNSNNLLYDRFSLFQSVVTKGIEGVLMAYSVQECVPKDSRLQGNPIVRIKITPRIINLILYYVPTSKLKEFLEEFNIDQLELSGPKDLEARICNFFASAKSLNKHLDRQEEAKSFEFKGTYNRLFSNLILIASKVNFSSERKVSIATELIKFLREDRHLYPHSLDPLVLFFQDEDFVGKIPGKVFFRLIIHLSENQKIRDKNLNSLILVVNRIDADYKYVGRNFIHHIISNSYSGRELVSLASIVGKTSRSLIIKEIESRLETRFNFDLYFHASWNQLYDYRLKITECIDFLLKGNKNWGFETICDRTMPTGFGLNWFVQLVYELDIQDEEIQRIGEVHPYFEWLVNLENFDYSKFNPDWLKIYGGPTYQKKFESVKTLKPYLQNGKV